MVLPVPGSGMLICAQTGEAQATNSTTARFCDFIVASPAVARLLRTEGRPARLGRERSIRWKGNDHENRWRLSLRRHPIRGGSRPRHGRRLPLHGLPDVLGLGLPHGCTDQARHVCAYGRDAKGLRQDGRKRQPTPANLLPDLRHPDLLGASERRHQGGRAARRRHSSARRAHPARSILVPLVAALAAEPVDDQEAGEAAGVRREGRFARLLSAYRLILAISVASSGLSANTGTMFDLCMVATPSSRRSPL